MAIRKKNKVLFITLISLHLLFTQNAFATKWELQRYELYGGLSSISYFGDIGGAFSNENLFGLEDIDFASSRPSLYFGGRYYLKERIAIQTSFNFGIANGSDQNSKYTNRGYKFTNSFFQPKINLEFTIIRINNLFGKNKRSFMEYSKPSNRTFLIFTTSGAGYAFYKVRLNDKMKNDKIRTDTLMNYSYYIDTKKTSALTWNTGIGIKYFFITPLAISACISYNYIFTDYFDGFSTSSNKNDLFWMVSFGLNYRLPTNEWGKINFQRKKKDSKKE